MKILFQGDSITDAGRFYDDKNIGYGYPKYAIEYLNNKGLKAEYINLGISGNKVEDLIARFQKDFLDIKADIVILLIGINDTWHRVESKDFLSDKEFEKRLEFVLKGIKESGSKLIMLEEFLLPNNFVEDFRLDANKKRMVERKLGAIYADKYIELEGKCYEEIINHKVSLSDDGVHPNDNGSKFIGEIVGDAVLELIK